MVRLQFDSNNQYKITLPKALIDAKGWQKGDEIRIILDEKSNIILKHESAAEKKNSENQRMKNKTKKGGN